MTAPLPRRVARTLPCQGAPGRWLDRESRTFARARCRVCPVRSDCARQALERGTSYGMWAGVWIDGQLDAVADQLQAVATVGTTAGATPPGVLEATPPPQLDAAVTSPIGQSRTRRVNPLAPQREPYHAVVLVRSSGHCEIMAPGCRLSADGYGYRVTRRPDARAFDATQVYLRCTACAHTVADIGRSMARRLGYAGLSRARVADAPFFWRQSRSVRLTRDGQMLEVAAEAACA